MNKQEPKPKIIQVYNKKAKTTYLYEDIAYWNPELKQGRHKHKGIGKFDARGQAIYNEYYLSRLEPKDDENVGLSVVSDTVLMSENLIMNKLIAKTGLKTVLS